MDKNIHRNVISIDSQTLHTYFHYRLIRNDLACCWVFPFCRYITMTLYRYFSHCLLLDESVFVCVCIDVMLMTSNIDPTVAA